MNYETLCDVLANRQGEDITVYTVDGRQSVFTYRYTTARHVLGTHWTGAVVGTVKTTRSDGGRNIFELTVAIEHIVMVSVPTKESQYAPSPQGQDRATHRQAFDRGSARVIEGG